MLALDFDGTIVDVRRRYHAVFCEAYGASDISLEEYWQAKRELVRDDAVCAKLNVEWSTSKAEKKKKLLELDDYLAFDELLVDIGLLSRIMETEDCLILTKRRNSAAFVREIQRLGLSMMMDKYTVLNPSGCSKTQWVSLHRFEFSDLGNIIIGDSEEEMAVSTISGFEGWFVDTGLRKAEYIRSMGLDFRELLDLNAALLGILGGGYAI